MAKNQSTSEKKMQQVVNQRFTEAVTFLKKKGIVSSNAELAQKMGISVPYMSRLVNPDKYNHDISFSMIQVLTDLDPELSLDFFLTPSGKRSSKVTAVKVGHLEDMDMVDLPLVEPEVMASFTSSYPQTTNFSTIRVPAPPKPYKAGTIVHSVIGKSMEPTIVEGAKVICEPISISDVKYLNSGVYVFVFGDMAVVKRVRENRIIETSTLELHSDNPDHGSLVVDANDIRACFKVLRVFDAEVR